MKSFALVVCRKNETAPDAGGNPVSRIIGKLSSLLKRERVEIRVDRVSLDDGLEACIIRLPYSAGELYGRLGKRAGKFISEFCSRNNILKCYFPKELKDFEKESGHFAQKEPDRNPPDTKFLFKSLLTNILDAIYTGNGINLGDLDIAIIRGENREELLSVIKLLCASARFITVLSEDRESINEELAGIYNDWGLSVGVSSDFAGGIRNADVVISLGRMPDSARNLRHRKGMLLINLCGTDTASLPGGCTVINGVDVKLPGEVIMKLGKDTLDCFGMTELGEIIFGTKYECYGKNVLNIQFFDLTRAISRDFAENGWKIAAFNGRHSLLSLKDVREAVRESTKAS